MRPLTLGTALDLRPLDTRYRELYASQAARLSEQLSGLTDDQWRSSSRCTSWTAHQTMQHVAGVRLENARIFEGGTPTWSGNFDPHRSPQEDIDTRKEEAPAETLRGFGDATEVMLDHLAARATSDERRPMLWGELADFRLLLVHIFWDSFVHERDVLLPLGLDHRPGDDELRFAVAYGLLLASVGVRMQGRSLACEMALGDAGTAQLEVVDEGITVVVDDREPAASALVASNAGELIDALAGRGTLTGVLDGSEEPIELLSGFGRFLAHG